MQKNERVRERLSKWVNNCEEVCGGGGVLWDELNVKEAESV